MIFLDVMLTGDNGEITSNLYRKPTAGNALLRVPSHPVHTINSIPVGEFLMLKRLSSRNSNFKRKAIYLSS